MTEKAYTVQVTLRINALSPEHAYQQVKTALDAYGIEPLDADSYRPPVELLLTEREDEVQK